MVGTPPPHPGPGIVPPVAPIFPLHEIIAHLRKYDGHSDAREFMDKFRYDMATYGLSREWALRNFDRIVEGDALSWWSAKYCRISAELDQCQNENDVTIVFDANEQDFYSFFDNSAQESTYRRENKTIKFKLGDCPTKYVTEKLRVPCLIDANMSECKKIAQLIKGLPYDLRQTMVLQNVQTVQELLSKLRNLSELYDEHKNDSRTSNPKYIPNPVFSPASFSSSSRTNQLNNFPNQPTNYPVQPNSQNHYRSYQRQTHFSTQVAQPASHNTPGRFAQQVGPQYPKGRNLKTPEGLPICNYCHYANHITRDCEELRFRNARRDQPNSNNNNTSRNYSYNRSNNNVGPSANTNSRTFHSNAYNRGQNLHSLDATNFSSQPVETSRYENSNEQGNEQA